MPIGPSRKWLKLTTRTPLSRSSISASPSWRGEGDAWYADPDDASFGGDRERAVGLDAGLLERLLQPGDFGLGKLHQRRAHHGALDAAEQDQAFLHAVVHVEERRRIERLLYRI